MSMGVIGEPGDLVVAQNLLQSDIDYFAAGAESCNILGGTLNFMPAFSMQPGGCVLHSLELGSVSKNTKIWLRELQSVFAEKNASLIRFYLQQHDDGVAETLSELGYIPTVELGLVAANLHQISPADIYLSDVDVTDREGRKRKILIAEAADSAPDGHTMSPEMYVNMELEKCAAGYMSAFLCVKDDTTVGAVNLAVNNGFARAKNLLVHSAFRRRHVGLNMIKLLMAKAVAGGARHMGVYALEGREATDLYRQLGFHEVTRQYEWTKKL